MQLYFIFEPMARCYVPMKDIAEVKVFPGTPAGGESD
jgi:hypothetical protein